MMNTRATLYAPLLLLLTCATAVSQPALKSPDDILIHGDSRPKVLLVGSMHFAYYGYDAHKTSEANKIDFLSPKRQAEIEALVDYLARFKPNKVVVEHERNTTDLLDRYRRYKAGKEALQVNETDQIAFRLLDRFNLDTLYGADVWGLVSDLESREDSTVFRPWLDEMFKDFDYQSDDPMSARYREWYDYQDEIALKLPLLDLFKLTNSDAYIVAGHGAYLVGDFKLGEYRGADVLAINWYSRNLRIFRNIQRLVDSPDDRILVLFGSGHLGILHQQFESSPEFELVPFGDLEN